jgi:hypothetical protein
MAITPTTITCCRISEKFCAGQETVALRGEERAGDQQRDERPSVASGGSFVFQAVEDMRLRAGG